MDLTEKICREVYNLCNKNLPNNVVLQVKKCLLDYLGAVFAGKKIQEAKINKLLNYNNNININHQSSKIIGMDRFANIETAILVNGISSHVADIDDGVNDGIIHLGSPIFSVLLSLFKKEELTADRFFKGIVAGYETAYTLAASIQPLHKELGYHATGTCGTIGAAVAVAVARKGSLKDLINSFSTAVISTSGMLKVIEDGSELKSYNVGKASLMGYISSNLAFSGFEVPKNVLEGTNGFFKMFTGKEDIILANVLRKGTFAIQKVYFKPFAACRYCHPAIEASLNLTKHKDLEIENIEKIVLHTYYWAVTNHDHSEVNGITSARMSIPYSIALALVKGKAGISEYTTENISNKRILNVAKKVEVISDEEFTKIFPSKTIALIQIFLKNGDIIKEQVDFPKGEPENPLTKLEIENKFTELAKYGGKTQKQIDQIISYVWDLENNLDKLYELL